MRRRNPAVTEDVGATQNGPPSKFTIYVGTFLAPKVAAPVSVYLSKSYLYEFWCLTPDREYAIGSGYFGSENRKGCVRQHMLPGLIDPDDRGNGYGTILYLAGNMVVAAGREDPEGSFPWKPSSKKQCTYSRSDERSDAATRAWKNLVKHDFAEEDEEEGESETVEESYDVEDYISTNDAKRTFHDEHEGASIDDITIEGSISITGTTSETITVNYMQWGDHVLASGLVIHLSDSFFDEPANHAFVPPRIFAAADWSHTEVDDVVAFAIQNGQAADTWTSETFEGTTSEYLLELLCHLHDRDLAEIAHALERKASGRLIPETQAAAANPRRGRQRNQACPTTFSKSSRSWDQRYGARFDEPEDMTEPGEKQKNPLRTRTTALARRLRNP